MSRVRITCIRTSFLSRFESRRKPREHFLSGPPEIVDPSGQRSKRRLEELAKLERGERPNVTFETLGRYAAALGKRLRLQLEDARAR